MRRHKHNIRVEAILKIKCNYLQHSCVDMVDHVGRPHSLRSGIVAVGTSSAIMQLPTSAAVRPQLPLQKAHC